MTPVLLIAGGSRGIGAATARLAGEAGYAVAVNYKSDAKAVARVVETIEKSGSKAVAIQGDMAVEADVERVFAQTESTLGPITRLVYSCAITGPSSRVEAVATQTLRAVFELNVYGAFYCCRAAIRRMSTRNGGPGGSIVLVSSVGGRHGSPNVFVWYAASKAAMNTMTTGLSLELAQEGIRVNAVSPGAIDTDIHPPAQIERLRAATPMGRVGTPEEAAEAILFLLSDKASFITGANITVSGGR